MKQQSRKDQKNHAIDIAQLPSHTTIIIIIIPPLKQSVNEYVDLLMHQVTMIEQAKECISPLALAWIKFHHKYLPTIHRDGCF